jgi:hypothetical protein
VYGEEASFNFPRNETGYFPVMHCEGRQKQGVDCFHSIYEDGPNADRYGIDYRHRQEPVTRDSKLNLTMAPGGGWVAKITRKPSTGLAGIKKEKLLLQN